MEKLIRINRVEGEKRGRADAYYGNVIIEFEKSLSATLGKRKSNCANMWPGRGNSTKALHVRSSLLRLTA